MRESQVLKGLVKRKLSFERFKGTAINFLSGESGERRQGQQPVRFRSISSYHMGKIYEFCFLLNDWRP